MTTHAAGTFTVASWDENTYSELGAGAKLTRAAVSFALEGDLAGQASWDALMYYRPDGTAAYTGLQRFEGTVGGTEGSFVVQADGEFAGGEASSRWTVVPGSGTGGLAGLTGSGSSVAGATPPGRFEFDYELG
jgi:hypothetical protein